MNSKLRPIAPLLSALLACSAAFAADWPQWRGPNRDDVVADFKAPAAWPKEFTQKWKVAIGVGDSSPILVGGKLYATGRVNPDEITYCLDAATGTEIWRDKFTASPAPTGPDKAHPGPRGTPVLVDGKLIVSGATCLLSCFDAATGKNIVGLNQADGKLLWQIPWDGKASFNAPSPIVTGTTILFTAQNRGITAMKIEKSGDAFTPRQLWKNAATAAQFCTPVLKDNRLYGISDRGLLFCLKADTRESI